MDFVSWDDEIPNRVEIHKIPWFQTTNQQFLFKKWLLPEGSRWGPLPEGVRLEGENLKRKLVYR